MKIRRNYCPQGTEVHWTCEDEGGYPIQSGAIATTTQVIAIFPSDEERWFIEAETNWLRSMAATHSDLMVIDPEFHDGWMSIDEYIEG